MSQELPEMPPEVKGLSYKTAEEVPQEIKDLMYREWLPRIVAAILGVVKKMPPEHRDAVLVKMAEVCSTFATPFVGVTPDMGFEEYRKHASSLQPPLGPAFVEQTGDIVHGDAPHSIGEDGRPICICPLVQWGMIEPFPELCICGASIHASFIETATGKRCSRVDVIGSPLMTGESSLRYRVYLKPPLFTTTR